MSHYVKLSAAMLASWVDRWMTPLNLKQWKLLFKMQFNHPLWTPHHRTSPEGSSAHLVGSIMHHFGTYSHQKAQGSVMSHNVQMSRVVRCWLSVTCCMFTTCAMQQNGRVKYQVRHFRLANLTHWGRDKMATISQTTFSNAFFWMKMYEFWLLRFHWNLFSRVQLTIFQHCFR